jgi:CRISPR-associated endonuclease/helicase Cas3
MEPLSHLLDNALRVSERLQDHERYLAHLPSEAFKGKIADETLADHMTLVLRYASQLVQTHQIDPIVDALINKIVIQRPATYRSLLADYLKRLFVDSIAFHDFGKINEHFQQERMRNASFRQTYPTLFKPAYGHSELGAYLFVVHHLETIQQLPIPEQDETQKVWLSAIALLFATPILLHHNSQFETSPKRFGRSQFLSLLTQLNHYNQLYQFTEPDISLAYLDAWDQVWSDFQDEHQTDVFPLFSLLRLNFSLLTAADYLATSEYMNQAGLDDLGVLTADTRQRLIQAAGSSQAYNAEAFRLAEQPDWNVTLPTERNKEALNQIRLTMAVEVIRTVRANADKRLFYLEAPTGGGKTNLSMLAAAELLRLNPELNKVFYVFPFTTLIIQTHQAILETWQLSDADVGLLHAKAGFQHREQKDEGEYGSQWRNQLHNQFAHFPVCLLTHIRFFDILKSDRKDSIYLMHRLANSIVIIDELQSYPPQHWDKMLYWIDQYARYFNIRFVLMSATLPRIDKLKLPLDNRPGFCDLLPDAKNYFINPNFRDRVRFRFDLLETPNSKKGRTIDLPELTQTVLHESKRYADAHGERVFTMIEFIYKKSATEFANQVAGQYFDKVLVLSGTILESRRREVINYLKRHAKDRLKVLLITTQVVEAGVDIDMDLGFKNVSLIDSDEQLAGRINRNVTKDICEVFLFRLNEPGILYKHDDRFAITRDQITLADHKDILQTKDFGKLYDLVIKYRDKVNSTAQLDNFNSQYLPTVQTLNYPEADRLFRLIDSQTLSVFVPLLLPIVVKALDEAKKEAVFSTSELAFLSQNGVYQTGSQTVDGAAVWELYRSLEKLEMPFADKQVNQKIMQGILSKFTFSIFYTQKLKDELCPRFTGLAEDGLDNYLYLKHYDEVYHYETGLDQSRFDSSENAIL